MAKQKKNDRPTGEPVVDYRHKGVTRLDIPPVGLAARGQIVKEQTRKQR